MHTRRLGVCLAIATSLAASDLRLLDAVKRRDPKAFETLLTQRVEIDAAAPDGATALSWAAFLDLRDMAEKLISAGAKVNTAGDYGETPLTLALANGDTALAQKLLKAGADPKITRWNGETALMIAAGVGSVEEVRMLLDAGADVNGAEPKTQQNALMWAAAEGHTAVVDLLLQRGANAKAATKSGFTPLIFAAIKDDAASVKRLLAAGANANDAIPGQTPDRTNVLTIAASKGSFAAAMALVDGGADPNVTDKTKNTPLHAAAQAGALDLVKKLLAKGASPNVHNEQVKTTAGFGAVPGEQTPLLLAARAGHLDVMRALIDGGADTKLKAQDGASLLLVASSSGRIAVAKYAFEFDKDVTAADKNGQTAMHKVVSNFRGSATQDDMTEVAQFLADIGVPLDEKDSRGRTPIQVGDVLPLDKPIQRIADIIVSRGGTPKAFPKEYKKP